MYHRGLNFLPNDRILDLSKFKAFAHDKLNATQKLNFAFGRVKKIVGKWNCFLPAVSPFPTLF